MLRREEIAGLLEMQRRAYALLLWLREKPGRPAVSAKLTDAGACREWLAANRAPLPPELAAGADTPEFANLFSSFFTTSFQVSGSQPVLRRSLSGTGGTPGRVRETADLLRGGAAVCGRQGPGAGPADLDLRLGAGAAGEGEGEGPGGTPRLESDAARPPQEPERGDHLGCAQQASRPPSCVHRSRGCRADVQGPTETGLTSALALATMGREGLGRWQRHPITRSRTHSTGSSSGRPIRRGTPWNGPRSFSSSEWRWRCSTSPRI